MAKIEDSMPFLLVNEGGYSDNPHDRGGCTNHGITQSTLTTWRHHPVSCMDVRNLSIPEATQIYKVHYWDALRLDSIISQNVATALFDVAVNRGVGTARQYAAGVCSIMGHASINDCDPHTFVRDLANRVKEGYLNIVVLHPSQKVFLKGWLNRVGRMLTLA